MYIVYLTNSEYFLCRFGCFGGVITTVGMETIAWYRYEGTVDPEGIGIEMERLAAREISHEICSVDPLIGRTESLLLVS